MQNQEQDAETEQEPQEGAKEYLESIQGLTLELDRAMNAIVQRELPSLQESLRCQQARCAELAHLRSQRALMQSLAPGSDSIDPDLAEEIQAATDSLLVLNRQYSALLKHSGNTLRLLVGLFRSYPGPNQPFSGMHVSRQSWSCEV